MEVVFIVFIVVAAVLGFAIKQNAFGKFAFITKVPVDVQVVTHNDEEKKSRNEKKMTDRAVAFTSSINSYSNSNTGIIEADYDSTRTNTTILNEENTFNFESYMDEKVIHDNSIKDLENMNKAEHNSLFIQYDQKKQFVTSIHGKFSNIVVETAEDALHSLYSVKTLLGLEDPSAQLNLEVENEDTSGKTFTFKQYYESIEVLGYKVTVSVDHNGKTCSLQSCIIDNKLMNKSVPTTTPRLSSSEIHQLVQELYPDANRISSSLIIYSEHSYTEPVLAYYCYIRNSMDRNMRNVAVLDANSGKIIYEDSTSF